MTADDLVCCRLPGCAARLVRCVVVAESSRADVNRVWSWCCAVVLCGPSAVAPAGRRRCRLSLLLVSWLSALAACLRRSLRVFLQVVDSRLLPRVLGLLPAGG